MEEISRTLKENWITILEKASDRQM